jgi:hypothetical protein
MTRLSRAARGKYDMVIGSRVQVMNGTAHHTSGGLTKEKLFRTKNGRIVSKSKHFSAKRENRLLKAGYGTRKGKFGYVKIGKMGKMGKSRKQRGGIGAIAYALQPEEIPSGEFNEDGAETTGSSVDVQLRAGNATGGGRKKSRRRRSRRYR